ncbi:hypothetical protein Tco_1221193 [Tanacetum coccineum]
MVAAFDKKLKKMAFFDPSRALRISLLTHQGDGDRATTNFSIAFNNMEYNIMCISTIHRRMKWLFAHGTWYCKYCQNIFTKEKFVERNENGRVARRVACIDTIEEITKMCIRVVANPKVGDSGVSFKK